MDPIVNPGHESSMDPRVNPSHEGVTVTLSPRTMDPFEKFGLIYNPEKDTVERLIPSPRTTTKAHNSLPNQTIFTKDIPLNTTHNTWMRLYTPINPTPGAKLPLILYLRGSGFVLGSASITLCHDLSTNMAIQLPAVVLSLEYRVAPENRLPAAYEDAVEALLWIQKQALGGDTLGNSNTIDFSRFYMMGTSAGGNIAYHAGLRALDMDLKPLVIRGYIFDHPAFCGLERSASELRLADDELLGMADCDMFWDLALPKGCNRDHEYSSPWASGSFADKNGMLGRCLVNTRGGDVMVDHQLRFANMLKENGVEVKVRFQEEGHHCKDVFELATGKGSEIIAALKQFLSV